MPAQRKKLSPSADPSLEPTVAVRKDSNPKARQNGPDNRLARSAKTQIYSAVVELFPQVPNSSFETGAETAERHDKVAKTQTDGALGKICRDLRNLQNRRVFCLKQQQRADRATESYIVNRLMAEGVLGRMDKPDDSAPEAVKKKYKAFLKAAFAKAAAHRKAIERGDTIVADEAVMRVVDEASPLALASFEGRRHWDDLREQAEKQMLALAAQTPGAEFVEGVRGFGLQSLAIILGEAGNLSNYASVSRLWKRMGLAVINGERQQKVKNNKELAIEHGYSPRRRSAVWVLTDSMFRHQWNGEKDEDGKSPFVSGKPAVVPGSPAGPYGEVYARRRAATEGRENWPDARRHADAKRVMSKALLADLWGAWNGKARPSV